MRLAEPLLLFRRHGPLAQQASQTGFSGPAFTPNQEAGHVTCERRVQITRFQLRNIILVQHHRHQDMDFALGYCTSLGENLTGLKDVPRHPRVKHSTIMVEESDEDGMSEVKF